MEKYVYLFTEGNKEMGNLLGGKGANLAEMSNLGLPVPRGFTVTTEACTKYYEDGKIINDNITDEIFKKLAELETITGKKVGDYNNPLLLSVRSGSRASMPGMMDTVLNLGLNDEVAESFAKSSNNPRFIYDSYRRFIQMYADVVKGFSKSSFERVLDEFKEKKNVVLDLDLDANDMKEITEKYKNIYKELSGNDFPQNAKEQLIESVTAVFRSWNNERAIIYRRMNDIPNNWGTAVNIQEMVYGNISENSGTGVAFTRNPATGENALYGEYLINAQGEDVVAGVRTPEPISTLKEKMPEVYEEFTKNALILENHYKDMQDMEFTIENGKLFMLQTRNGKRTAAAALKIAVDLVNEGMITKKEAILKVDPKQLDQLLHKEFDQSALKEAVVIAKGLAASPGAATGKIYFTSETVSEAANNEEDALLVRLETSPEDIQGMSDAKGILTLRGGMTSHAAVVARGMGRCCVSGCEDLIINELDKTLTTSTGDVFKEGDYLSLDGSTGLVYGEKIATVEPNISGDFDTLMSWADEVRTLKIRTNADTEDDAKQALKFGAEGIGLCRTEHMFFAPERIFAVRQMILSETLEQREAALAKILPMQKEDFEKLFRVMKGLPITIRYLDPPLHEFLPHTDEEINELADSLDMSFEALKQRINSLKEFNPMMGHRGCRLAITYPEIAIMQTKAVIKAAINVKKEGIDVLPEIMIPLVCDINELKYIKEIVLKTANEIIQNSGIDLNYQVGTMIELPRATILANEIASEAEFFSFGTNDLTQMVYGFSRDDTSKFMNDYYNKNIFENDPFSKLDQNGVGELVKIACEKGRSVKNNLKLGVCGEHGGDPASIEFFYKVGLNYVSCSPFRVPIARLAAAHAVLKDNLNN